MATAHRINRIAQVALPVRDLGRATAFYRDVLGLTFLFEAGDGMAFLDAGGVRLLLTTPEGQSAGQAASILYYQVDDIDAMHASLVERDIPVEAAPHMVAQMPDHELWMAFYRDTEDNVFALMEERR